MPRIPALTYVSVPPQAPGGPAQRITADRPRHATNRSPARNGTVSFERATTPYGLAAPQQSEYRWEPRIRPASLHGSGRPGSLAGSLKALAEAAGRAAATGAGLLVASEMFLTGYAIGADM